MYSFEGWVVSIWMAALTLHLCFYVYSVLCVRYSFGRGYSLGFRSAYHGSPSVSQFLRAVELEPDEGESYVSAVRIRLKDTLKKSEKRKCENGQAIDSRRSKTGGAEFSVFPKWPQ